MMPIWLSRGAPSIPSVVHTRMRWPPPGTTMTAAPLALAGIRLVDGGGWVVVVADPIVRRHLLLAAKPLGAGRALRPERDALVRRLRRIGRGRHGRGADAGCGAERRGTSGRAEHRQCLVRRRPFDRRLRRAMPRAPAVMPTNPVRQPEPAMPLVSRLNFAGRQAGERRQSARLCPLDKAALQSIGRPAGKVQADDRRKAH